MVLHQVMELTIPAPKVEEMPRVIQEGPLLTGETPEAEVGPQLSEEFPLWESKGSNVSVTGSLQIRIPFSRTPLKWNHTIVRGDHLNLGRSPPPTFSIIHHPLVALREDSEGAWTSVDTPQVKGHPYQGIFLTTHLIEDQDRHHLTKGLLGAQEGSQVFLIRTRGVETHVRITVQEKSPMSMQVPAWSAGMRPEPSLIHTMEIMVPLGHRGAPERFMGEAHVQRGTGMKQQFRLGKIIRDSQKPVPPPPQSQGS